MRISKSEQKLIKAQNAEHRAKYKAVVKKIRRLKDIKREDKKVLISDLQHANGDLMATLYHADQFKNVLDYFDTVNAYIRSEIDCYGYSIPGYIPNTMKRIIDRVTAWHNNNDRYNSLKAKIMGTDE